MLRWHIDYFGLKLLKKQLVPKNKKNKKTLTPPPTLFSLKAANTSGKVPSLWEVEGFLIIRERGFKAKKAV